MTYRTAKRNPGSAPLGEPQRRSRGTYYAKKPTEDARRGCIPLGSTRRERSASSAGVDATTLPRRQKYWMVEIAGVKRAARTARARGGTCVAHARPTTTGGNATHLRRLNADATSRCALLRLEERTPPHRRDRAANALHTPSYGRAR